MGAKDWLTKRYGLRTRLESLEKGVLALRKRVAKLEARAPTIVPIETLAPEPYELLKPFHAVVEFCDDSYIATFYDANISASGDTQQEAVENL
ncbi:MAG: hypothetical protein FJ291_31510, partial [Planctomycetes bacterium]|nr:hypothetical protein [Planctomycetota bacterium]